MWFIYITERGDICFRSLKQQISRFYWNMSSLWLFMILCCRNYNSWMQVWTQYQEVHKVYHKQLLEVPRMPHRQQVAALKVMSVSKKKQKGVYIFMDRNEKLLKKNQNFWFNYTKVIFKNNLQDFHFHKSLIRLEFWNLDLCLKFIATEKIISCNGMFMCIKPSSRKNEVADWKTRHLRKTVRYMKETLNWFQRTDFHITYFEELVVVVRVITIKNTNN